MQNVRSTLSCFTAGVVAAVFIFTFGFTYIVAQNFDPAQPAFSLQDCKDIESSLPGALSPKLRSEYHAGSPWSCSYWGGEAGSWGSEGRTHLARDLDADLYFQSFDVQLHQTRSDAVEFFEAVTSPQDPFGSSLDNRDELDFGPESRAVVSTFFSSDTSRYDIQKSGAGSNVNILVGNCTAYLGGMAVDAEFSDFERFEEYHFAVNAPPGSPLPNIYKNLHPDFDHGAAQLHQLFVGFAEGAVAAIAPKCGASTKPPAPQKPKLCELSPSSGPPPGAQSPQAVLFKNHGGGDVDSGELLDEQSEIVFDRMSGLCTEEEAVAAQMAAEQAEVALARANHRVAEAQDRFDRLRSVMRALENEISILEDQASSDTFGSDELERAKQQAAVDLVVFRDRLSNARVNSEDAENKLGEAKEELESVWEVYQSALGHSLACRQKADERARIEAEQARRAAAEAEYQRQLEEMARRAQDARDAEKLKEFREKRADFFARQRAGEVPSSVRPPYCPDDDAHTEKCEAGEVREEPSYLCSYQSLNTFTTPDFNTIGGEYALTDSEIRGFRSLFQGINAFLSTGADLLDLGGPVPSPGPLEWDLVGPNILPSVTVIALGAENYIDPILEQVQGLPSRLKHVVSTTIPVRIKTFEITESFVCKNSGPAWEVVWEKQEPQIQLVRNQSIGVQFICRTFGSSYTDKDLLTFDFEPGCKPQTEESLIRKYGELTPRALRHAWREAQVPANDHRCPVDAPE